MVTGNFPMGIIHKPFTALGLMCDGSGLSMCCPRSFKVSCPAADMSAPGSNSTSTCLVPEDDVILTTIVGVGSVTSPVTW